MPIRREGRSRFAQTHCDGQMRSKYPLSGPSDTSPSVRQQPIPAGPTRKKKPPIKRARVKKKTKMKKKLTETRGAPPWIRLPKQKKTKRKKRSDRIAQETTRAYAPIKTCQSGQFYHHRVPLNVEKWRNKVSFHAYLTVGAKKSSDRLLVSYLSLAVPGVASGSHHLFNTIPLWLTSSLGFTSIPHLIFFFPAFLWLQRPIDT